MQNSPGNDQRQQRIAIEVKDGFREPPQASYALIESIYRTSDSFCQEFRDAFPTIEAFQQHLTDLQSRPGALFLLAQNKGTLLGYLFIEPRSASKLRHTADLNMGVADSARGTGVGTLLLDNALSLIDQQKKVEITYLMVRADNRAGQKLYVNKGFEVLAVLERDTKIGNEYFDGLLMRRFSKSAV